MIHLNESFWKSIMLLVGSTLTAIGGYFFGNFFTMKQDIAILQKTSSAFEERASRDMERIETGLNKLNDKIDVIFERVQGPAYQEPRKR